MDRVLGYGVLALYVFVYLDDIVVVTETFDPDRRNASDVAVAGVLTQQQEDDERVISYFPQKLTTPQKISLAALLSIAAFRGYIEGYHFTMMTESSALTHILKTKWKVGSRCSK